MRDLGNIDPSSVQDCTDKHNWSTRDVALGSTGRRMSDPEASGFVMLRGVFTPRTLADDGARLLTRKERAAFEHVLRIALTKPDGHAACFDCHLPADIRAMSGETPSLTKVNTGIDGKVVEPRWVMQFAGGEMIGGRIEPSQLPVHKPQRTDVNHRTIVHHHHHAPVHVEHGLPARQLVLAAFRKVSR